MSQILGVPYIIFHRIAKDGMLVAYMTQEVFTESNNVQPSDSIIIKICFNAASKATKSTGISLI